MPDPNANPLPIGFVLQEYRIERVLGHGGFGVTYLARDRYLNALVAIKEFLPREFSQRLPDGKVQPRTASHREDYAWGLDRFMREARALARFKHPNIVRVARMIEANATAYMVMEYEHGLTLSEFLKRHAPRLNEAELLGVFVPLLDGLAALHRLDLIHRDIKPGNIYLRREGPLLLDFGAARQVVGAADDSTLTALVTPGYAPLEQYSNQPSARQGPWSDLYAVGATMYMCMFGKAPIAATARSAALGENEADPYVTALDTGKDYYSPALLEAVDWALALRVKDRPQTALELKQRLLRSSVAPMWLAVPADVEDEPTIIATEDMNANPLSGQGMPHTAVLSPTQGGRPRPRWPRALAAAGALALAGIATYAWIARAERDDAAFAAATKLDTIAAYAAYLETCQRCAHWDAAQRALGLRETELAAAEAAAAEQKRAAELAAAAEAAIAQARSGAAAAPGARPAAADAGAKPSRKGPPPGTRIARKLSQGGTAPELVVIGGGSFKMGDPSGLGNRDEEPVHTVKVAGFALGIREVTRAEFAAFVAATGYETEAQRSGGCRVTKQGVPVRDRWSNWRRAPFSQSDTNPVICVSLNDAEAYLAWLSAQTKHRYRLPTEAEWEFAARAGSGTLYWWGDDIGSGNANCAGCGKGSKDRPLDTGSFGANRWGLLDTAGNVAEWTCSAYTRRYSGDELVCAPFGAARDRVLRGGSWAANADRVRSSVRGAAPPEFASDTIGFRVAADL
jgi:formylglycine-generating enzyme required for sulfatase activity/serine/threonine protein kinase